MEVGVGYSNRCLRVISFKEKPKVTEISKHLVNMGIAVCNTKILKYCRRGADLFGDVIPRLISSGEFVYSYVTSESFVDIGTMSALESAVKIRSLPRLRYRNRSYLRGKHVCC